MGREQYRRPYNGFPTWATWNLVLWSTNEEHTYDDIVRVLERKRKRQRGRGFTASTAKLLGYALFPFGTPDMPQSYLADVRWGKVAEAWNELVEEGCE